MSTTFPHCAHAYRCCIPARPFALDVRVRNCCLRTAILCPPAPLCRSVPIFVHIKSTYGASVCWRAHLPASAGAGHAHHLWRVPISSPDVVMSSPTVRWPACTRNIGDSGRRSVLSYLLHSASCTWPLPAAKGGDSSGSHVVLRRWAMVGPKPRWADYVPLSCCPLWRPYLGI
jgi:hypothetical protein